MKISEKNKELYNMALKKWNHLQVVVAIEEMAELTKELTKDMRHSRDNIENIAEEIADVSIMLEQMAIMYNIEDLILEYKNKKLSRLEHILNVPSGQL